jgi:glycosyltransferase involved in cell wall biosynthesis
MKTEWRSGRTAADSPTPAPPPNTIPTRTAVVIPAYEEAKALGRVLERCLAAGLAVTVVDDGSRDQTAAIAGRYPVRLLRHARNRGKGAALLTGIEDALAAGASAIVTLDADGQHRPEDVARLVDHARRLPGAIVVGSRRADRGKAPRARYLANRVADFWISWAAGLPLDDTQSGFRLYPADALRRLLPGCSRRRGFAFESEILIEAAHRGIAIGAVAIPAIYGLGLLRPSHFRPLPDISRIVLMVAAKLLARGLHPSGLARVLIARVRPAPAPLRHPAVYRDDLP